jgi:hypothetical protein
MSPPAQLLFTQYLPEGRGSQKYVFTASKQTLMAALQRLAVLKYCLRRCALP